MWADRLLLTSADPEETGLNVGGRSSVPGWMADARAFEALGRGRRQRVLVQPALGGGPPPAWFWQIAKAATRLDWLVLVPSNGDALRLPADWGDGYDNVWLGDQLRGAAGAKETIQSLRGKPAKLRFLIAGPLTSDLGELQMKGIEWVIAQPGGLSAEEDEWVTWLRLQCMAFGIPLWINEPFRSGAAHGPGAVHPHLRQRLTVLPVRTKSPGTD